MAEEQLPRVTISRMMIGICFMQCCCVKDATEQEILDVANRGNPAGTKNGWLTAYKWEAEDEARRPVQCADYPDRHHVLVGC